MNTNEKSVGNEIVERLQRFNNKLDSAESIDQLPQILTVRKVKLNLSPRTFSGTEVKETRKRLRVSQAIFAEFIGVSTSTLQDWEQGVTEPSGPARRILDEMARDPEGWLLRFRELADVTSATS